MPAVVSLSDIVDRIFLFSVQAVSLPHNIHLLRHIHQSSGTVQMVIPARLNRQRSRRNERCNISHIKVFPQMGNIITAAITVE